MSHSPSSTWPAYARVPPFLPVPLRARADGWTPERQARFIGLLAETGSVVEAARAVGMSREAPGGCGAGPVRPALPMPGTRSPRSSGESRTGM